MEERETDCLLGRTVPCGPCSVCGWNAGEAERRKARIRAGELEADEEGLMRLVLHGRGEAAGEGEAEYEQT